MEIALSTQSQPSRIFNNKGRIASKQNERSAKQAQKDSLVNNQNFWHKVALYLGVGSVLLTSFAALSQFLETKRSSQIQDLDSELSRLDQDISGWEKADASQAVAETNWQAQQAGERAANALQENARLRVRANALERDAEVQRAANLTTAATLVKANAEIEHEKASRVKLAASLLPRTLFDQSGLAALLKQMLPMTVMFEIADDPEALETAQQLAAAFSLAGWRFNLAPEHRAAFPKGIGISIGRDFTSIEHNFADDANTFLQARNYDRQAKAIIAFLVTQGENWDTDQSVRSPLGRNFPPSTLIVNVGSKPNHELDKTLQELGHPEPTVFGNAGNLKASGNRKSIPAYTGPELKYK